MPYYFKSFAKMKPNKTNEGLLLVERTFNGAEKISEGREFKPTIIKVFDLEENDGTVKDFYTDVYALVDLIPLKWIAPSNFRQGLKKPINILLNMTMPGFGSQFGYILYIR